MLARNGRKGARSASARIAGSVCETPQMRHARLRLCLSISPESSAANQRLLARTLAANQRLLLGGTLWLPPRRPLFSGNPFIGQELGLSPIRHLRSEVVGRLPYWPTRSASSLCTLSLPHMLSWFKAENPLSAVRVTKVVGVLVFSHLFRQV